MEDKTWTKITEYICISTVLIIMFLGASWILSPQEFTFKIEMDNNTREAIKSVEYPIVDIEQPEKVCYAITHEVWGVWDTRENIIYNRTVDTGFDWEVVRCPHEFEKQETPFIKSANVLEEKE